jgi:uncharacterized membrane protein HdeD (DUF308 family)
MDASIITKVSRAGMWFGVLVLVLGLVAFSAPRQTGMTLTAIIGILFVLGGLARCAFAWMSTTWGDSILRLLFGILMVIVGGMAIAEPQMGLQIITTAVIIYLIVDGISQIVFSFALPPAYGGTWLILGGIASIVLGVLIWKEIPWSGEEALAKLLGIKLMIDAIGILGVSWAAKSAGKSLSPAP